MKVRLGLLATSAALLLLVGCGGGNEAAQPSDASAQDNGGDTGPTELAEDLPTAVSTATVDGVSTEATTAESKDDEVDAIELPDICTFITPEQVEATVGDAAPTATGSYGSSTDPAGGQCLWTTDPAGDPFSLTATNLELVVFQPDGPLPPPDYAPAPGSDEVVDEENQWYFADGSVVYLLRVTGEGRIDAAVLAAAEALVPALRDRA